MKKKTIAGLIAILVVVAVVAIFSGCVEKEEAPIPTFTPTPIPSPTPTPTPTPTIIPTETRSVEILFTYEDTITDEKPFLVTIYNLTSSERKYDDKQEIIVNVKFKNMFNEPVSETPGVSLALITDRGNKYTDYLTPWYPYIGELLPGEEKWRQGYFTIWRDENPAELQVTDYRKRNTFNISLER